ncbi:MAG: PfkB family carbohydrate kinase [Spirochaetaceae bacterium]|nr:PfkB family carbohydrate kinase [Spirochaetaceae bacterium]
MILVCGHNNAWQLTYLFGAVTPGTVNRVREVHRSAAGKGVNVARVLAALQAPTTLLAYLGGPNGMRVRRELESEGIATEVIDTAADTRTCVTLLESAPPPRNAERAGHRRTGGDGPAFLGRSARAPREAGGDGHRDAGSAGWSPAPGDGPRDAGGERGAGQTAEPAAATSADAFAGGGDAWQAQEPGGPPVAAGAGELDADAVVTARQVTELVEPAVVASAAEQERFAAAYDRLLEQASAVVIAGSAIGGADREVYAEMVRRARRRGVPTLLDAYHGHGRAALAAAPSIVKINRAELAELAGTAVDAEPARIAACRGLCDRHGVRWVMVSAGAEGIEACDGRRLLRAAAPAVPVVNPIGSGDAAAAGVVAALVGAAGAPVAGVVAGPNSAPGPEPAPARIDQADLASAARLAVACGTANCLTATPGAVTPESIRRLHAQVAVTEAPI